MVIYKYLAPARLDVLERCRIRFTPPAAFNDPFEFRPHIESAVSQSHLIEYVEQNFEEILKRELLEYPISVQVPREKLVDMLRPLKSQLPELFKLLQPGLLSRVSASIQTGFNDNVGVLCLSEVRDSLLMWGHYTDNHEGFVVGFDTSSPFFATRRGPEDEFGFLRQVRYRPVRPRVTLADTTSVEWFETKCEAWAYEREWRLLRVLHDAETQIEALPRPIFLFDFPAGAVAEIIVGLRSPPSLRDRLKVLVTHFPRAKLLVAREHPEDYALEMEAFD